MSKLNHKEATSSIDWADPAAAVQIVTAASKQEKAITILVNEKLQASVWKSVLKGNQDTVDLKKVAEIFDKAVSSSRQSSQATKQAEAADPVTIMVIVALTGLFGYMIRKNYAIQAN